MFSQEVRVCDFGKIYKKNSPQSQLSIQDLVDHRLRYSPEQVFIYEGDNDLNAGKDVSQIMEDINLLVTQIHQKLPETNIVLISTKPSPSRWHLKTSYTVLNDLMRQYATTHDQVNFMNVWNVMLDKSGRPISEIFIADSLHMNAKGYVIWNTSVIPFMK